MRFGTRMTSTPMSPTPGAARALPRCVVHDPGDNSSQRRVKAIVSSDSQGWQVEIGPHGGSHPLRLMLSRVKVVIDRSVAERFEHSFSVEERVGTVSTDRSRRRVVARHKNDDAIGHGPQSLKDFGTILEDDYFKNSTNAGHRRLLDKLNERLNGQFSWKRLNQSVSPTACRRYERVPYVIAAQVRHSKCSREVAAERALSAAGSPVTSISHGRSRSDESTAEWSHSMVSPPPRYSAPYGRVPVGS